MDRKLSKLLKDAEEIVFVCSGNIIRSAFAEIYAKHLGISYHICSLGTEYLNDRIHERAQNKLLKLNVDEKLIAEFKPSFIKNFKFSSLKSPIYFVMTQEHYNAMKSYVSENIIFYLSNLLMKDTEILDPYFFGGFDKIFLEIKEALDTLHPFKK